MSSAKENFEKTIRVLEEALATQDLRGSWVVVNQRVHYKFNTAGGVARDPVHVDVLRASRFSKRDAERVAEVCKNGNGQVAEAIRLDVSVEQEIETLKQFIDLIQKGETK